jgi:CRISPR-associated protein Cmr2
LGKSDEEKIDARLALLRLFGNEKDKIEDFLDDQFGAELKSKYKQKVKEIYGDEGPNVRGRLVFYPTFLDKIGLDIIAPHDRERRTVKVPIQFEVAPENAEGTFSVLYFPFDLLGREGKDVKEEVAQDLEILRDAIPAMLTKYGFGAKTTAGYGVAEIKKIEVNGRDCEINWNKALEVAKSEIGK